MPEEKDGYKTIEWSKKNFEYFKRAYTKAVNEGAKEFKFQGNDFVTGYAKYLIEYLEDKF